MRLLLLTACIVLIPAMSQAEIMVGESLSWIAADSDLIVRGRITEIKSRKIKNAFGDTVTVKVAEVLRGKKQESVTFTMDRFVSNVAPSAWVNSEMLLFLKEHAGQYTLRKEVLGWSAFRLNNPQNHAFSLDMKKLKKREEILKTVRSAVQHLPKEGKAKKHSMEVPFSSEIHSLLWGGSSVFFWVPVTNELETYAKKWLKDKDQMLQQQGVRALRYFKSDENVELLKPFLSDKNFYTTTDSETKKSRRVFYIRSEAYNILKSWEIDVEKPVTEENL